MTYMLNLVSIKSGLLVQDLFHASKICLCVLSNLDWLQLEFIPRTLRVLHLITHPVVMMIFKSVRTIVVRPSQNMTLCVTLRNRAKVKTSVVASPNATFAPSVHAEQHRNQQKMQREYDLCMSSRLWGMFSVWVCAYSCATTSCASGTWIFTHLQTCMHTHMYTWLSHNWDSWQHLQGHVSLYNLICSSIAWTLLAMLFHGDGKHTMPCSIFSHSFLHVCGFCFSKQQLYHPLRISSQWF